MSRGKNKKRQIARKSMMKADKTERNKAKRKRKINWSKGEEQYDRKDLQAMSKMTEEI